MSLLQSEVKFFRVADVDQKQIVTHVNQTVKLMCRFPAPIKTCRFTFPGEPEEIKLNPDWERTDDFRYHGNGLEKGHCGVLVVGLKVNHHGTVRCFLDPDDGGVEVIGSIEIYILNAPEQPKIIFFPDDNFQAGNEIEAHCTSNGGRPAANITWFLNGLPLDAFDESGDENTINSTWSKLRYHLKPDDNAKLLVCRSKHEEFADGHAEASLKLNVTFLPFAVSQINVSELEGDKIVTIGPITFKANPKPTFSWMVDKRAIKKRSTNNRLFVDRPILISEDLWNTSLTINKFNFKDYNQKFSLEASNTIGTTRTEIKISDIKRFEDLENVVKDKKFATHLLYASIVVFILTLGWLVKRSRKNPNSN